MIAGHDDDPIVAAVEELPQAGEYVAMRRENRLERSQRALLVGAEEMARLAMQLAVAPGQEVESPEDLPEIDEIAVDDQIGGPGLPGEERPPLGVECEVLETAEAGIVTAAEVEVAHHDLAAVRGRAIDMEQIVAGGASQQPGAELSLGERRLGETTLQEGGLCRGVSAADEPAGDQEAASPTAEYSLHQAHEIL